MAEVKVRDFSREEAYQLANRMADKEIANYIIRETLMDKGFSVHEANEIIGQMRRLRLEDSLKHSNPLEDHLGLILMITAILVMLLYILFNNLS